MSSFPTSYPTSNPTPHVKKSSSFLGYVSFFVKAALIVVVAIGLKTLIKDEAFNVDIDVIPGDCSTYSLPAYVPLGIEDVQITKSGIAFLSTPRIPEWVGKDHSTRGYYHMIDMNNKDPDFKNLNIKGVIVEELFPHGISVYEDPKTKKISLFAINHALNHTESVIIYDYDAKNNELVYSHRVSHPLFYALNSVVAVGPRSFYATNDRGLPVNFRYLEVILGLAVSNVVYHDGETQATIVAADSIVFANGITASKDFSRIFVSSMSDKTVIEYSRKKDNSLHLEDSHFVGFYADNIHVDDNDHIWSGGVKHLLKMAAHMENPTKLAPSAAGRYIRSTNSIELVYVNNGSIISGVTTAVRWNNKLVLSPLIWRSLVICTLPNSKLWD